MKLETFNDVLTSIRKNKGREFHLLRGNGFSMAYDSTIFSYAALNEFYREDRQSSSDEVVQHRQYEEF
jgi:hypothetical protein